MELFLSIHGAVALINELDGNARHFLGKPLGEGPHFLGRRALGAVEAKRKTKDDLGDPFLGDDRSDALERVRLSTMNRFERMCEKSNPDS